MKTIVSFKTPDATYYATEGMTQEEKDKFQSVFDKYIEYDECIDVEFDTVTGEARVIPII